MRRGFLRLALIAGAVLALDQWTKRWASHALAFHRPVEVIGELLRLTYTRNSGVAFGLGSGTHFPYYLFSILAALTILVLFARGRVSGTARQVALALILGGALGNLIDRVRSGEVVDFIEVGYGNWHWPVFNVADSAVTIGVLMFALHWTRRPHPDARAGAAEADATVAAGGSDAGAVGGSGERRGAAGPVSRGGAEGPLA